MIPAVHGCESPEHLATHHSGFYVNDSLTQLVVPAVFLRPDSNDSKAEASTFRWRSFAGRVALHARLATIGLTFPAGTCSPGVEE